jgi:hypothetical protein
VRADRFPIVGIIIGAVYLARNNIGKGLALVILVVLVWSKA